MELENPLIWFDLESTDSDPIRAKIIEIYAVKKFPDSYGKTPEVLHLLINPDQEISEEATSKHGYTLDQLQKEPKFNQVATQIYDFFKGCDLAGYNIIKFDIPLLVEELMRAGIMADFRDSKVIDPFKIWGQMEPRNLEAAYKLFTGKEMTGAHQAKNDIQATIEVFVKMKEKWALPKDVDILDELSKRQTIHNVDLNGKLVYNDSGDECFNFGKYKGTTVEEVISKDPGYIKWIGNNWDFPRDMKMRIIMIEKRMKKNQEKFANP